MKVLVIDNSSFVFNKGHHYTNALNGLFIEEMIDLGTDMVYFQFRNISRNNICSFDLEEHGVKCYPLAYYNNKIRRYLYAYFKAIKVIKSSDFVYLYYPSSFKYIAFLCLLLRKPYGLYIRGMNGLSNKISFYIYKHAYTVFTVSDYFTKMVNQVTRKEIAHTIKPMIPFSDVDIVKGREYAEKKKFIILYLGRIAADKGLAELIQAAKQLREKGLSFSLQIVGDGEFSSQLSQMVDDLHLQNDVSLEGPVYDNAVKANYYKEADLYILPTYHEGFPRTLYEAMIFGTPIVTTFVGGIPALMIDKENCIRIEPRSVDSVVEALEYAMNNYKEMGKMAKNATALVAKVVDRNRPTHARQLFDKIKNDSI